MAFGIVLLVAGYVFIYAGYTGRSPVDVIKFAIKPSSTFDFGSGQPEGSF